MCTPYFVVMFTGRDVAVGTKRLNNACISQSTRVLQSLLRENVSCSCYNYYYFFGELYFYLLHKIFIVLFFCLLFCWSLYFECNAYCFYRNSGLVMRELDKRIYWFEVVTTVVSRRLVVFDYCKQVVYEFVILQRLEIVSLTVGSIISLWGWALLELFSVFHTQP